MLLFSDGFYAFAHKIYHRRSVFFDVQRSYVRMYMTYIVPAGDRAYLLRKKFDRDRDGFLSRQEQNQLAQHLALEALKGVQVLFQNHPVRLYARQIRFFGDISADSGQEVRVEFETPIWLAPAPPIAMSIIFIERKFEHTHVKFRTAFPSFEVWRGRKKVKPVRDEYGFWHITASRHQPLKIRFRTIGGNL